MEVLFKSTDVVATLDERGFVECIVSEGYELELSDVVNIHDALEAKGQDRVRVLINRVNSYSTATSLLMLHSMGDQAPRFRLKPEKVAYLVYQPTTGVIADFVGKLVFKHPPHQVFVDREEAIEWLLEDQD